MNIPQFYIEGTKQGDPLAMAMYGIGIIPLIELLQKPNFTQKRYSDEGSAACDLKNLRAILDNLERISDTILSFPSVNS